MKQAAEPTRIGRLLRELRAQTKMSVRDFAKAAGFDVHTTYQHYESAKFKKSEIPAEYRHGIGQALFDAGVPLERIRMLGAFTPAVRPPKQASLEARMDALAYEMTEIKQMLAALLPASDNAHKPKRKAG